MSFLKKYDVHHDVYAEVDRSKMTLRDFLAVDRTILSNQNTFLAYIRSALTLFVAGLTFIRFFDIKLVETIGWLFIPAGVITFIVGFLRYNRMRIALDRAKHTPNKTH